MPQQSPEVVVADWRLEKAQSNVAGQHDVLLQFTCITQPMQNSTERMLSDRYVLTSEQAAELCQALHRLLNPGAAPP